uniref:Major facilitator superfamily (MFS) profile domain-containing protein n=1 Tax=Setaria digitata TaxID=48799 RepID=A0A915PUE6_9BILA
MQGNVKECSAGNEILIKNGSSKLPSKTSLSFIPPDGGYGWIIVLASFFANTIVDGVIYSIGEALVGIWEEDFETTAMQASIVPSLLAGFYLLAGPLASGLANSFGCRLVVIAGAATTFVGLILSSLVPSLPMLYITFGVIGGIGFGLVYLPSILIVNEYFEKRRAFAMGIAVCGSGIGTTIFSQLFPFLLKLCENNWRHFLVCTAFVTLLSVFCGLCYRKLPSVKSENNEGNTVKSNFDLICGGSSENDSLSARLVANYSLSMKTLQGKISQSETEEIQGSLMMTSITTAQVMPQKARRPFPLWMIFHSMVDTSLLSDPSFILIAITAFLTLFCLFVPFIFLGKQANTVGATSSQQSYLLLFIGLVNIFGRIFCGLISDLPKVDPLFVHNLGIIIGGLATCAVPLLTHYWMFVVYTIPFAWSVACFSSLRTIICIELLGLEKLSNAFGMMMLCMGIAVLIGPPLAALLKDLSGNFDLSFYVMGALLTLSGMLCIPLRMVKSRMSSPPSFNNKGESELQFISRTERF